MRGNLAKRISRAFTGSKKRPTSRLTKRSTTTKLKSRSGTLKSRSTTTRFKTSRRQIYHLVNKNGVWTLRHTGNSRNLGTFDTKREALIKGRKLAKSSTLGQLVVHRKDNTIEVEFTYGRDPGRSKG